MRLKCLKLLKLIFKTLKLKFKMKLLNMVEIAEAETEAETAEVEPSLKLLKQRLKLL